MARPQRGARAPLALVIALLTLVGCAAPVVGGPTSIKISGRVYGAKVQDAEAGRLVAVALAGQVTCGGVSAMAATDGSYSLTAPVASAYQCTVSAPQPYAPETVTVPGVGLDHLTLDFGPRAVACAPASSPAHVVCPSLQLQPGTLSGAVTDADSRQAIGGASVQCWSTSRQPQAPAAAQPAATLTATTDGAGHYTLAMLPVGPYACVAEGDLTLRHAQVAPGVSTTLNLSVCNSQCPAVTYHLGPVMHTLTAYVIFWLPAGRTFEPQGSDTRFESLVERYFTDVGGTAFYDLLTQYWDRKGPVQDSVTLGGTYVDTTPYLHAATQADPLRDHDVQTVVADAIGKQGWTADLDHAFFVVTAYGAEECAEARFTADCTFDQGYGAYCGYHDTFEVGTTSYIYAYIPVNGQCAAIPALAGAGTASPNGDAIADGTLNVISHEQFEAVSDPLLTGWYDSSKYEGEIGDKCQENFGSSGAGGGNVTLGHGHTYTLQAEWSDLAQGCAWRLP